MNVYETISNQVEKERENIIDFLIEFINQKSINPDRALPEEPGGENLCQEWLRDQMVKMDVYNKIDIWEVASKRPNLVGVIGEEKQTENVIMFNGHVDVVPVTKQQYKNWTIGSPWKAERIGDRIYGRGASDMKGGNTAFLWAAKILTEAKFSLEGSLIASINVGEESSNFDIGSRAIVRRGYRAPLLINAEPTNLIVCPATKGAFFFKITIPGQGAHVAYNNLALFPSPPGDQLMGVNAIGKAKQVMSVFENLNHQWGMHNKHPISPPGGMNNCLVKIRGGEYLGAIPEYCELIYIVWFNPNFKSEVVMEEIRRVLDSVVSNDYWLKDHPPKLEMPYLEADKNIYEPIDIPESSKECVTIAEAYEEVTGEKPVFQCFPAVCDANAFYELGIPSIILGPGDLTMGTHAENEYVPIEQVIIATKIYASIAVKWLGLEH